MAMRKFNIREKEFLKLLEKISKDDLEFFSFFLQNDYFQNGNNSALVVLPQQKEALLFIKKDIFDDLKLRKFEIRNFIEMLALVEYLKQNRLIDLIPNPQSQLPSMHVMRKDFNSISQVTTTSNIILNQVGAHLKFPDMSKIYNAQNEIIFEAVSLGKYTYELIIKDFMGLLFVSEELKYFVQKGFKSEDDLRYKYGQIATWLSISMALLFGLIGIYNPFENNSIKSYKIDSTQFDTIINYNKEFKDNTVKILETLKKDTTSLGSVRSKKH
jgi:hypothetical protein